MLPAFAGLEIVSSMARSTTKSSSNNSTILSIASSMARSTTKSNSNSSNNQQQQQPTAAITTATTTATTTITTTTTTTTATRAAAAAAATTGSQQLTANKNSSTFTQAAKSLLLPRRPEWAPLVDKLVDVLFDLLCHPLAGCVVYEHASYFIFRRLLVTCPGKVARFVWKSPVRECTSSAVLMFLETFIPLQNKITRGLIVEPETFWMWGGRGACGGGDGGGGGGWF